MAVQIGSMYFSVGADTRDYQSKMAQVDATARHVADNASGSLRRIAETATGFLVAQAIPAVINGFKGLATEAFAAYGNYERLSLSLETLAKRDLMEAATLEKTVVVGQRRVELSAQEIEKLEDLRLKRDVMLAQMREEEERHRQLVERWGEEGLAVQTHAAKMAVAQKNYADLEAQIAQLQGRQGQYVDIVQRSTEVVLDEAEAKRRAAEIAQELLHWQQQLNINSPFDEEGVQQAMRTAAAYGFVTEQALAAAVEVGKLTQEQADAEVSLQRLVQATTDFAAGTGRTTREVELISLALGQVKAKGKLAGQEILQLTNAGVNVRKILADAFNVTTQELVKMQEKGLIPADQAIKAIVESFEKDFGGAAKEQTRTWQGLTSTLSDLKKIGLREFFTGTFQAIQPYVADFVDTIASEDTMRRIREVGDAIGEKLARGLERVQKIIMSFQMGGVPGLLMALGVDYETVKTLQTIGDLIEGVFSRIQRAFQEGGLSAAIAQARDEFGKFVPSILTDLRSKAAEWGQQVRDWVGGIWANVKDWWTTGGGELVTGTIERWGQWVAGVIRGIGQFNENARGTILEAIGKLWRGLVDWWNDGGGEIVTSTLAALGKALSEIGAALWDVMQNLAAEIARYAGELWRNLVTWWNTGGQQATADTLAAVGAWFADVLAGLAEKLSEWGGKLAEWFGQLWGKLSASVSANYQTWALDLGHLLGKIIAAVIDFLFIKLPELAGQLVDWFKSFFGKEGDGSSFLGKLFAGLAAFVGGLAEFLVLMLGEAFHSIYENSEAVKSAVDAVTAFIEKIKEGFEWLKALPSQGGLLVTGLLSGISAKAGETLTSMSTFVADNIKGAVNWIEFLWQVGRDLVEGLRRGIESKVEDFKRWIVDWAKRVIPQPLWSFFGIHSPSLLMMELGRDLVAGLVQGIGGATPELVRQVSETIGSMMSAMQAAFGAIGNLGGYATPARLGERVALLIEDIKQVVEAFLGLSRYFGGPESVRLRNLRALMEPLSEAFGGMNTVIQAIITLARANLPPTAVRSIESMIDLLGRFVPRLVEALSGSIPSREVLANIAMLAETVEAAAGGIQALVEAVKAIASVAGIRIEQAGERLIWMAEGLLRLVDWLRNRLGQQTLRDLGSSAQQIVAALAPWKAAAEAIGAIADVAGVRIETASQRLIWMTERLLDWMHWLQTYVPAGLLDDTAEAADLVVRAVSPWAAVASAVQAIAQVAGTRIESAAQRLAWMTEGLIRWMNWLIDYLPVGVLEQVSAKADLVVRALAPWRAVADAVQAIDEAGGARVITHEQPAARLMWLTKALIDWTNWLIEYLPVGVLEQVAAKADMIVRALSPWQAVADAVKAINEAAGAGAASHSQPAAKLIFLAYDLTRWTSWLLDNLPVGMLERVAAQAEVIVRSLSPWRAIVDAVAALNTRIETAGIPEKAGLLAEVAGSLALALEGIISRIGRETLDKAALVGRKLMDVLAPWEKAIKLAADMRAWRYMPDLVEKFSRFARQWVEIVEDLADAVSVLSEDGLDLVKDFAQTLDALVGGLSDALTLALALPETWSAPASWEPFMAWVKSVFLDFYSWVTGWTSGTRPPVPDFDGEQMDLVALVGSTLSNLMSGLRAALDLALALPETWQVPGDAWDNFIAWVRSVFLEFYTWVNTDLVAATPVTPDGEPGDPSTSLGLVATFGSALSGLMGGLRAALDVATAIPASWSVDAGVWDAFVGWVRGVFMEFYTWVNTDLLAALPTEPGAEPGDPNTSMGLVGAFGSALSGLMGGLSAALQLALGFPQAASFPTGEVWDNFKGWVMLVFAEFQTWVNETFHPEDPDEFAPVASFGNAMQAVFGGLVSALEFFQGIVGWVGMGSTFQERLTLFLNEIKARFVEIATFVTTELDADVMEAVGVFGDKLGDLADGLSNALDFFAQVADTDPAAYTSSHEFRVRMQALIRTIHETVSAFNEYVVQENGDLWVPVADRLFDAFERMVSLMRNTLNLFVDLQASNLPTPNQLQTFIGLVIQLFQNLTGAILGAGDGAQTGTNQIVGRVVWSLGVLDGYVDDFYTMGRNFALALADGIRSGLGAVGSAAAALGEAAAGATGDALQIASPSRVAMGLGEMFVGGFVNALLAGQRDVDAAMRGLMGPQLAPAGFQVDARRTIVVEFRGQAGGGVPLPHSQFDALKRELIWELQRGA